MYVVSLTRLRCTQSGDGRDARHDVCNFEEAYGPFATWDTACDFANAQGEDEDVLTVTVTPLLSPHVGEPGVTEKEKQMATLASILSEWQRNQRKVG